MKDWKPSDCPAEDLVPVVRERGVVATLKRRMKARGIWVFKAEFRTGWPDYLLVLPSGEHVYVETKALDGELRVKQRVVIERMRGRGLRVFTVYSAEDVAWLMNEL